MTETETEIAEQLVEPYGDFICRRPVISGALGKMIVKLVQEEYDAGRAQAIDDNHSGTRKMYSQLLGAWGRFYFDLMQDRYGVFLEHVSDITSEGRRSYECGYNSVAREYIESIDGPGALDRIWDEVTAFRTAHYKKQFDVPD